MGVSELSPKRGGRHGIRRERMCNEVMSNKAKPMKLAAVPGQLLAPIEIAHADRYDLEQASRARAQSVYLGGDRLLARSLGRYKIFLDARDHGFASHVALDGYWETWLTQLIARRVKSGMFVADIGANFGYYSVLMADLVGPAGRLLAVEPNPAATDLLADTLAINGFESRTRLVRAALGARQGRAMLHVPTSEPKNARVVARIDGAGAADASHFEVPVYPLDALVLSGDRIDFLKIDTEGAEEDVIAGFAETIGRTRPEIVLEFNPGRCRNPSDFLARLRVWYPVIRVLGFDGETPETSDADLLDPCNSEDRLICLASD